MDWFLFIAGLLVQAAIGILGIYVTFRPPRKPKHLFYLCVFGALTFAAVSVALAQKWRSDIEQAQLQGKLDSSLKGIDRTTHQIAADMKEVRKFLPAGTVQQTQTVKPWNLSADQLVLLSRRVAPFATKLERGDLITCVLGDRDSTRFAESLVAAFRAAGWVLGGSGYNQAVYSGLPTGIVVKLHSKESAPPALGEFVATLREAGIEPSGLIDASVPENEFQIIVGARPD